MTVANSRRGVVTVDVDGATYVLRCTANEFIAYEDETGRALFDDFERMTEGGINWRMLRLLLFILVQGRDDFTLEQAGVLITEMGVETAFQAVTDAVVASMPQAADGDAAEGDVGNAPPATKAKKVAKGS
ncbi:hypothetical protein AN189_18100 [Loktanella sp. 3ANDIMAR09]|uniref:hypothetical protein n=1 Tax=Loktanella sp. 3ANDIMAR09 TaxID=1225657 RepID=UPI0006F7AE24|nr:hypothetical protein [Loktanella sp. 3ANDIMAR09]KQI66968.1 hypothetical protein AN189_18100 [Loktanella sp. 3ANDIMAR09]